MSKRTRNHTLSGRGIIKCSRCGNEIPHDSKFCPYCGMPLNKKKRSRRFAIIVPAVVCLTIILVVAAIAILFLRGKTASSIEIGDTIKFGSYEQDNDLSNGKEPIEWIVLDNQDGRVLVTSRHCLDYVPYNTEDIEVTWESSSLRDWLNGEFLDEAFSPDEQRRIISEQVENPGIYFGIDLEGRWIVTNTEENVSEILYQTPASRVTKDRIFLPAVDEAVQYLGSGAIGYPSLTASAKEKYMQISMEMAKEMGFTDEEALRERYGELEEEYGVGCCFWWLRSPGFSADTASVIVYESDVVQTQNVEDMAAVRPVMWLQLD